MRKFSSENPFFFLKSICQNVSLFKDSVATNIPTNYTFNALEKIIAS